MALAISVGTSAQQADVRASRAARPTPARPPSVAASAHAEVSSTIQGNALTATNTSLAGGNVRLRDARSGRIVDATVTDKAGIFTFRALQPGSYVVELMGEDRSVLAASDILNINEGETASALVKMPFRVPPYGRVLGPTAASAAVVIATAAASGVLATQVTADPASPRR
jgi:hypothetical protein